MADAERSMIFVLRASIEDFNQKMGEAQKNFKRTFGNIQRDINLTANQFLMLGGIITSVFAGAILKTAESSEALKEPLDKIKGQFDALFKTIAENPAILNLLNQFADLLTKVVAWIEQHPALVKAFLAVGLAITAVGVALKGVAFLMSFIQGLSGVGLAKVGAGIAGMTAAYFAINAMMKTPVETPEIPAMASGGIFRRPTLAMIGEGGPEAVMPLSSLGSMGGGPGVVNVHLHGIFTGDEMGLRQLGTMVQDVLRREGRRSINPNAQTSFFSQGGSV